MDIIDSVLPYKVDIYIQSDIQDPDTGAINKSWNYYKTIPCHAKGIISNSTSTRSGDQQQFSNQYHNHQTIEVRTLEKINIRHKITNIRNGNDQAIWTELNYPTETPTVFEVVGATPINDPFGAIIAYNCIAKRSDSQVIGI